ncbi:hypothetical protein BKA70DRAFT_1280129 [Coprinopsis sp. MPI-PUGE-AT-0042]|nr:hypothetical protein BKA70DRAFT_1280129 [Coprinopsis sp. MPI-PUGE-AT-0042]
MSNIAQGPKGPETTGWSRSTTYYMQNVVIGVEGCLYSVPKQALTSQSTFFEEMFDIGDQSSRDGGSDEEPIVLEGCTSVDFECLLKVIYPRPLEPNPPELSQDERVSVLKLSTLWHMGEIRDAAIWELSTSLLDPVTRIQYSKRYHVSKWLTEGIVALARNLGDYKVKDLAELLGWETTALIYAIRDKARPKTVEVQDGASGWFCFSCNSVIQVRKIGATRDWCCDSKCGGRVYRDISDSKGESSGELDVDDACVSDMLKGLL